MKNKILLLVLALLSFSCFEEEDTPTVLTSGTYSGTFQRSTPYSDYATAHVTLVLEGKSFSGSSDRVKYPAIGKGTYQVEGNKVTFQDMSFWTAEFDWTLILNGTFSLSTTDDMVTLTRKQGDITDVYRLTKQQTE